MFMNNLTPTDLPESGARATAPGGGSNADAPSFDWPLADRAEALLRQYIGDFLEANAFAARQADRMRDETGTDFFEWTDHLVVTPEEEPALLNAGLQRVPGMDSADLVYEHPQATLPRVLVRAGRGPVPSSVALKPEFVADFIARNDLQVEPEGEPGSRLRRVIAWREHGTQLEAVERRAYRGFAPAPLAPGGMAAIVKARELWQIRPRRFEHEQDGFRVANQMLERVLGLVGRDLACQFFFEAERAYWQDRNRAGQIQKRRQDQLGLGWGNHDHHTFRCSRAHFVDLVEFLLRLGFRKRERYYAGAQAGWGAQIMEQPMTGIVVFADVDLMPEETQVDFSTTPLPPATRLGTVGLWVGLHGESFLEAGMHHLEARFDFERLSEQLQRAGVNMMKPFSNFEFLRQAFTEGERWPVRRERIDRLVRAGLITPEQGEKFLAEGALGSHLENLQRHGGFKGFNQSSVSAVIAATDPRREHFSGAPVAA